MSIWTRPIEIEALNKLSEDTLTGHLGIEFTQVTDNSITAAMPVDERTQQPYGILHGGASVVLAETLGSVAANFCLEEGYIALGLEVNANHVRSARNGSVIGTATPIHLGKNTHVWMINIENTSGHLICTSRLTVAIRKSRMSIQDK